MPVENGTFIPPLNTNSPHLLWKPARKWHERLLIRRWHSFLLMQKKVVKQLHNIVTVSDCSRQDIAADFGIQPSGISLVHNGIDTAEFRPLPEIQRRPRALMATASADAPLKGLRYLLKAYANLLADYPDLELLLVSKPQPGGKTERLIRFLGIAERVKVAVLLELGVRQW